MPHERQRRRAGRGEVGEIPDSDGRIITARRHQKAIGADGDAVHLSRLWQLPHFPCGDVEHAQHRITSAKDHNIGPRLHAVGDAIHRARHPSERPGGPRAQDRSLLDIEDTNQAAAWILDVVPGIPRRQTGAVAVEGEGPRGLGGLLTAIQPVAGLPIGVGVEQPDQPIFSAHGERPTVGTVGQRRSRHETLNGHGLAKMTGGLEHEMQRGQARGPRLRQSLIAHAQSIRGEPSVHRLFERLHADAERQPAFGQARRVHAHGSAQLQLILVPPLAPTPPDHDQAHDRQRHGDIATERSHAQAPGHPVSLPLKLLAASPLPVSIGLGLPGQSFLLVLMLLDSSFVSRLADDGNESIVNQLHARGIGVMNDPQQTMPVGECIQLRSGQPVLVERFLGRVVPAIVIALNQIVLDEQRDVRRTLHVRVVESFAIETIQNVLSCRQYQCLLDEGAFASPIELVTTQAQQHRFDHHAGCVHVGGLVESPDEVDDDGRNTVSKDVPCRRPRQPRSHERETCGSSRR